MNHLKILTAPCLALLFCALPVGAQNSPAPAATDPWKALAFLEGTWKATGHGQGNVTTSGAYTFRLELRNHILARESVSDSAGKQSKTFDYQHSDLFYVYQDAPGEALKAIYFDNEGHVIHYDVSTPTPTTALFLSDASRPGPQLRLIYELKGSVMSGKFQIKPPGQADWTSYLEWSGGK